MNPVRFSLKWLLAYVALAAISIAALVSPSNGWATAVVTAISVCLLAAAIVAAAGAGRSQAFALGFFIGAGFYLLSWQAERSRWLNMQDNDLLTSRAVDWLYNLVKRDAPADGASGSGFMFGVGATSSGPGGNGLSGGFFGGGPTFVPDFYHFRKIAHWLVACYIGIASGLIARRLRSERRTS